MSQVFEVIAVGDPREWESAKHQQRYLAYPIDLKDREGTVSVGVEWSRKLDSDAPKVGDKIAGNIQGGQHGDKLKVDWDAMKEMRGGPTYSGGGRNYNQKWQADSQRDPEKVARIGRSHAQKVAVDLLTANPRFNEATPDDKRQSLTEWIDWFEMDVEEAAAQKTAQGAGHSGAPPPEVPPVPAQNPDDSLPF